MLPVLGPATIVVAFVKKLSVAYRISQPSSLSELSFHVRLICVFEIVNE